MHEFKEKISTRMHGIYIYIYSKPVSYICRKIEDLIVLLEKDLGINHINVLSNNDKLIIEFKVRMFHLFYVGSYQSHLRKE